jgi:uncharacterized membrane protein
VIGDGPQDGREAAERRRAEGRVCLLVACFAGAKRASKVRGQIGKAIRTDGSRILDEVVLSVGAAGQARVYDPRRTAVGTLTSALTWGVFGLVAGGLEGLGVWAVLGAICGGGYAYLTEHLLTKEELKQIGGRLPANSSAVAVFVQGPDPERVLASVSHLQATTASVAGISPDLSAEVYAGVTHPVETSGTMGDVSSSGQVAVLRMLLVRFEGERGAWQALEASGTAKRPDPREPQAEIVIQANQEGRRRVIDPATGTAAMSKSDVVSWGGFGLAWGAIVGFAGGGGALGAIDSALIVGVSWAIFGLVAGALYGLWAGRAISARRLKRIGSFVGPDTSLVVAWAGQDTTQDAIERWAASASERLVLRFNPTGPGVLLEV